MRRAANVDGNQKPIVEALRAVGATVTHLHQVGKGCPDLLVGFRRRAYLLEVKSEDGELDESQVVWHRTWAGPAVSVVRSPEDALRAIGAVGGVNQNDSQTNGT